tara:strand:+ start:2236 stop:2538 length:303 start_codon:yes stop_codon:yes gene_type:complete
LPSNPTRQKEEEEEEEKEEKETRVSLPFSFCKAKIGKKMMTRIMRDHQREFVSKKSHKTRVPSHSFIASLISSESQYPLAPPPPTVNSSCDDPSDRIENR